MTRAASSRARGEAASRGKRRVETLVALFGLLAFVPATAQEPGGNLNVYLMTMGPGAPIDERFGHNAIWIRDTVANTDLVYNFGTFDPGNGAGAMFMFGVHFAMGPLQYWLSVADLEWTLASYKLHQRDLVAQELSLTPAQRADMASRLAKNAREENKYYAYDYFRDNCSTRVRDLINLELGGALERRTTGKPAEGTLRFHTLRSITNDKMLFVAIDAAFGPRVDRTLDQWDEMFLPAKLQQQMREMVVDGPDGKPVPLVKGEFPLLAIGVHHVESQPPPWTVPFFATGLAIAGMIRLARSSRGIAIVGRAVAGAWLLLIGIGGVLLMFLWFITKHVATYQNFNLLLLSPICLALIPAFWYRKRSARGRWSPQLAIAVMVSVAIGGVLALLPGITGQDNKLIAALVALPTFMAALEALASWNRRSIAP